MRYTLESALPLGAFKPRGGLFAGGMTLHGGGGGFIQDIGNSISNAVSGVGDALSGAVKGVGDLGESIGHTISDAGVSVDNAVNDYVPGGWGTVAAVAVPFLAPEALIAAGAMEAGTALTAAQAAAVSSGTSAATSAIKGRSLEDTLKGAALAGATSYGLSSLGGAGGESPNMNDAGAGSSGYGEANELRNLAPKVDSSSLEDALKNAIDKAPTPIVSPDNLYTDQFINAFSNSDAPLPAFEPTAGIPSSDAPSPNLVPKGTVSPTTYVNPVDGSAVSVDPAEAITQEYLKNAPDPYEVQGLMEQARGADTIHKGVPTLYDKITNAPSNVYDYLTNPENTISKMGGDLYDSVKANPLEYGLGALGAYKAFG